MLLNGIRPYVAFQEFSIHTINDETIFQSRLYKMTITCDISLSYDLKWILLNGWDVIYSEGNFNEQNDSNSAEHIIIFTVSNNTSQYVTYLHV